MIRRRKRKLTKEQEKFLAQLYTLGLIHYVLSKPEEFIKLIRGEGNGKAPE